MNSVKRLSIENFTAFRKAEFEFSPGINVFIGENSTGKTHILKLMYTLVKVAAQDESQDRTSQISITNIFKSEGTNSLVRSGKEGKEVEEISSELSLSFARGGNVELEVEKQRNIMVTAKFGFSKDSVPQVIYLPSREVLTIFEGFLSLYSRREISLDETYYDLCLALDLPLLKNLNNPGVRGLLKPLERVLAGKVIKENGRFYIELPDAGKIEAHLVAEGFRKIAMLIYLIGNGSISSESIVIWDEPESSMNPALATAVVDFLVNLANAGAQIFLATHDYLLSYELSLRAEYGLNDNIKFFSLYREEGKDGVQVQEGRSMAELDHDPILDSFVQHHEWADELFYNGVNEVVVGD